jgi:hypothetical protein
MYPNECKSGYNKDICTPMFIAAILNNSQLWEKPRCLTADEWIKKM